jgi:hypothetical protein
MALTAEQCAWLVADERRWRRVHEITTAHPGVDVGGRVLSDCSGEVPRVLGWSER